MCCYCLRISSEHFYLQKMTELALFIMYFCSRAGCSTPLSATRVPGFSFFFFLLPLRLLSTLAVCTCSYGGLICMPLPVRLDFWIKSDTIIDAACLANTDMENMDYSGDGIDCLKTSRKNGDEKHRSRAQACVFVPSASIHSNRGAVSA